jgi:BirA family biotin operon repressor/biotin-[acetyl-CoA-carboxylase] ligase
MKHLHFEEIDSTQDYLISQLSSGDAPHLVSAKIQTKGRGRSSNSWDSYENALAFSFKISASHTQTLTSLEMGVLICEFIEEAGLKLKWPNDIINSKGHKCGGILIQLIDGQPVVGIGLNWGKSPTNDSYKTPKGSVISDTISPTDYKEIPAKIYNYILENRLSDKEIIESWNELCAHKDKLVSIIDDVEDKGIFKKIGPFGEAYLDINGNLKKFYAGSLIIH